MGLHRPGVQLHQVPHDREPEPQASVAPAYRAVLLPEAVKYMRQELGLDALTVVADADLDLTVAAGEADLDLSIGRRELDRVRQQVAHHLLQACEITAHGNRLGGQQPRRTDTRRR